MYNGFFSSMAWENFKNQNFTVKYGRLAFGSICYIRSRLFSNCLIRSFFDSPGFCI